VCDHSRVAVTVLVVDDHAGFRGSARRLLEQGGFEVVGEAADGASALELVGLVNPELVLLDVALPDMSGFEIAERLAGGRSKVILVSSRERRDLGRRVRRCGALGFIAKEQLSVGSVLSLLEAR
jgi:DNA-binding NarL/FixJ family response regulator